MNQPAIISLLFPQLHAAIDFLDLTAQDYFFKVAHAQIQLVNFLHKIKGIEVK